MTSILRVCSGVRGGGWSARHQNCFSVRREERRRQRLPWKPHLTTSGDISLLPLAAKTAGVLFLFLYAGHIDQGSITKKGEKVNLGHKCQKMQASQVAQW